MTQRPDLDFEAFNEALTEAMLWCASRASLQDAKGSLRTLALATDDSFINLLHHEREAIAASLIVERKCRMEADQELKEAGASLPEGKLLLFYPDGSLSDGAAEVASRSFFDADNVPPWDTWVYYGADGSGSGRNSDERFLISWIPRVFVALVNDSIDANPEECIQWASRVDRNFTRLFERVPDLDLIRRRVFRQHRNNKSRTS